MHHNLSDRSPKGDHNRRLSLGLDQDQFASAAGITVDELLDYEHTGPDHGYRAIIAERVGEALDRLESVLPNSEAAGQKQERHFTVPEALATPAHPTFDQRVQDLAYLMWEEDGRPEGRDDEYWTRARDACVAQDRLDGRIEADPATIDPETGKPVW